MPSAREPSDQSCLLPQHPINSARPRLPYKYIQPRRPQKYTQNPNIPPGAPYSLPINPIPPPHHLPSHAQRRENQEHRIQLSPNQSRRPADRQLLPLHTLPLHLAPTAISLTITNTPLRSAKGTHSLSNPTKHQKKKKKKLTKSEQTNAAAPTAMGTTKALLIATSYACRTPDN